MSTTTKTLTILTNDFHRTEYRTTKSEAEVAKIRDTADWARTDAERAFVRRVRRTLCGMRDCTCATTDLGER